VVDTAFDTIVLGGGSAGCIVAARLSDDPYQRVALVEAGPDYGPVGAGRWPAELLSARYQPGSHDWGYEVEAHGRRHPQWRGKVIGGSSVINAAGITWPTRDDLDRWEALGLPGWGFDALLPFFQRVEADQTGAWPGHGREGYLPVTTLETTSPLIAALQAAYAQQGVPWLVDFNDPEARQGVGRGTRNVLGMTRVHLAAAALDPVRGRPNLHLIAETLVDRLLWRDGRVSGVTVLQNGRRQVLAAERVVLTAGAFGTPLILLRSGIGPAEELRPLLGPTSPLHDLPGVGKNFWDQLGAQVVHEAAPGAREQLLAAGAPFGSLVAKVKSDPAREWFDLHVFHSHLAMPPGGRFFSTQIWLLEPAESGTLHLTSPEPTAPPRIRGGIGHPQDVTRLAQAIAFVRQLLAPPVLAPWLGAEVAPGEACTGEALRTWVQEHLEPYHHACGTARLGPPSDRLAVCAPDGRVYGFENLYVADASLVPVLPRAALHLLVLAAAEKVASGLLERRSPRS
jgi:choline dehydrogenase